MAADMRPPVHKTARNTLIEDVPQISCRRARHVPVLDKQKAAAPIHDDSPTPKASALARQPSEVKSPTQPLHHEPEPPRGTAPQAFDELYDITESESEEVEIRLSNSIKRRIGGSGKVAKYPSLIIPSPRHWPTIEKLKTATPLSPPITVEVPTSVLQQLAAVKVPSKSSAPSLDGSASGDELASLSSCPSTPDVSKPGQGNDSWEIPLQLDPASLSLLHQLSPEESGNASAVVIEVQVEEMRQISELPSVLSPTRIDTTNLVPATAFDAEEDLSALSVPSPGGFFASLNPASRHTWTYASAVPSTGVATEFYDLPFRNNRSSTLPTSTAATFYDVPWRARCVEPREQVLTVPLTADEGEDPVTAKKGRFSPTETVMEVDELDEHYGEKLEEKTAASFDRTVLWITSQDAYMEAVCKEESEDLTDSFADVPDAVPKTPEQTNPPPLDRDSPGKKSVKSVRFADSETNHTKPGMVVEVKKRRISPIHDGTFWEGWRATKKSQRARDVFQHRQTRVEAEHVKRMSCQKQHAEQLKGNYSITTTLRPEATRPISFLPDATEDEKKEALQQIERERQALAQMSTSSWHVSAQREINGGKLITSPIAQTFKARDDVRILDLHGQVHCSWAWNVAMEHPEAIIYTAAASDAETHVIGSSIDGPDNHVVCTAAQAWELPFDDASFDIISARHMHAHLRTVWPAGYGADEWDLTLRECLRILKPGGYLEFHLLDAELLHPEPGARALGVEFAFNLRTRGYDPAAGRTFLPRLKRAGFAHIKRAWMVLPVADVRPRWVDSGKAAAAAGTCLARPSADTIRSEGGVAPATSLPERAVATDGIVRAKEGEPAPLMGSTRDVRAMTGLAGARMWEQWNLKLSSEMGWSEERCLEGVAKALQEGGRGDAAWKCLVGWARKST